MNKKKLVFDVVIVTGNEDVFKKRFLELHREVDFFIIFGTYDNIKEIKKYQGELVEKINYFELPNNFKLESNEITNYINDKILEFTIKKYQNFEDFIFFSFSNEIPQINLLCDKILLEERIQVLNNVVFQDNLNFIRKYPENGSIVTTLSFILYTNNFFEKILFMKEKLYPKERTLKNGYKFLYSSQKNSFTYYCPYSKKIVCLIPKKKLKTRKFIFNFSNSKIASEADYIFNIDFISDFPEELSVDFNQKVQTIKLFLPKIILYGGEYKTFKLKYKMNEIPRILSNFYCSEDDIIEIHFGKEVKKLKYSDVKNPS